MCYVCVWIFRNYFSWSFFNLSFLWRIASASQQCCSSHLEGLLLEGIQTSSVRLIIRHCLRTYATIDKTRDAEASSRSKVSPKPYVDEVRVLWDKAFIQQMFVEHLLCLGLYWVWGVA